MRELLVKISNMDAGYDSNIVLKNVNLNIHKDDFIGIIGPNGGGKTTLLKAILGLIKPLQGSIDFIDTSATNQLGYLPQRNQIDPKFPLKVMDVVLSGLMSRKKILSRYSKEDKSKALDALSLTGSEHLNNKHIGSLSGGQLQRVLLSRAIVSKPNLLILDEPDTFVDNEFEKELYELLKELNKEMAILMVSHDLGMISTYVKSIACVNEELHHHDSNKITPKQLSSYKCPIQLITHGNVPHTVLHEHN